VTQKDAECCGAQAVCASHCDRMMWIAKWNALPTVCIIAKSFGYDCPTRLAA